MDSKVSGGLSRRFRNAMLRAPIERTSWKDAGSTATKWSQYCLIEKFLENPGGS